MNHLTEEEMIERYYAEDGLKTDVEKHLRGCKQCTQAYEELERLLGNIHAPEAPARGPEYGAQVWRSIQGSLRAYEPKKKRGWFSWPRLAYATVCLLFMTVAFMAGRMWENIHRKPALQANTPQPTKERVVLFVLDSHLDRSARLLVQLSHAAEEERVDQPLQTEARQLLVDNRLYRQSINQANDPLLAAALDHLERVLLELANSPDGLDPADITRIEKEMNTEGLLFQIRVLRSKVSEQEIDPRNTRKGALL